MDANYPGPQQPMLAAQLRVASEHAHRLVFTSLQRRGFDDLRQSHFDLFRFPGPDGLTPTELAHHVGLSKQGLNPLLNELVAAGYLTREPSSHDGRQRVLRLTARGLELVTTIREALEALEAAISAELGPTRYATFRKGLQRLQEAAADWPDLDTVDGG